MNDVESMELEFRHLFGLVSHSERFARSELVDQGNAILQVLFQNSGKRRRAEAMFVPIPRESLFETQREEKSNEKNDLPAHDGAEGQRAN